MPHEFKCPHRPEEALELQLQAAYKSPNMELGTELRSSGRPSAFDCSVDPYFMCAYTWVSMEARRGGGFLQPEVTGVCEPPVVGAGIQNLQ